MKKGIWILAIVLVLIFGIFFWFKGTYNNLVERSQRFGLRRIHRISRR